MGLEPTASAVTGQRYNQLNYAPSGTNMSSIMTVLVGFVKKEIQKIF